MFSSKSRAGWPGIDREWSHELRDDLLVSGAQRMSSVARGLAELWSFEGYFWLFSVIFPRALAGAGSSANL